MSIQTWIEGLVKTAVDEAMKDAQAMITAELQVMEASLVAQISDAVGAQIDHIALDAGAIATEVITGVTSQFGQLPRQIIEGVLQGIPNVLNPFKGKR